MVASLAVLGYGGYLATTMPIDVFPDLDRPRVVVMTECPGLAPEEVETLVTYPLESALLGATGVQDVRSQSGSGCRSSTSSSTGAPTSAPPGRSCRSGWPPSPGDMPEGVRPQMAPISSIMGQILIAGLYRQPGPRGGELAPLRHGRCSPSGS